MHGSFFMRRELAHSLDRKPSPLLQKDHHIDDPTTMMFVGYYFLLSLMCDRSCEWTLNISQDELLAQNWIAPQRKTASFVSPHIDNMLKVNKMEHGMWNRTEKTKTLISYAWNYKAERNHKVLAMQQNSFSNIFISQINLLFHRASEGFYHILDVCYLQLQTCD